MKAFVYSGQHGELELKEYPSPRPAPHEVLLEVEACGVCRTDLHVIDGELEHPALPVIPGHQIVGRVIAAGEGVTLRRVGDRVGVTWLSMSCGHCRYCRSGRENLCTDAVFTGYTHDGGYAEYAVAEESYTVPIPEGLPSIDAAPLLCAGVIGYRSYTMSCVKETLGIYGFGSAGHLVAQLAVQDGVEVYAFTREGDAEAQELARSVGAVWAGHSRELPPVELSAAIIFASAGELVPQALRAVERGGRVVLGGIHMTAIPSFPYELLWEERSIQSIANCTRNDAVELFKRLEQEPVTPHVTEFAFKNAPAALEALRSGTLAGSAVLRMQPS